MCMHISTCTCIRGFVLPFYGCTNPPSPTNQPPPPQTTLRTKNPGRKEIGKLMAAIRELTLEVYTALPKGHPG